MTTWQRTAPFSADHENEWRERWEAVGVRRRDFGLFLRAEFAMSMKSLGYLETPIDRMKLVRSDEKNLPLYYLAPFFRHKTAFKFWDDVLKYSDDQMGLFG